MIKARMDSEKSSRQNRVREALGRIYDQHPPHFREYLRRYKEDPTSRVFAPLAEAYRRMGRVDEAIEVCREGLGHHPDFHGGRVALAKCFIDKRQYAEARAELDRVVQFAPENLLAQKLLGDTCRELKDLPGSVHAYKMALMLSPQDVSLAEKIHTIEREIETGPAPVKAPPAATPVSAAEPAPAEPAPGSDEITITHSIHLPTEAIAAESPEPLFAETSPPGAVLEDGDLPPLWDQPAPEPVKKAAPPEPPPPAPAPPSDVSEVEALFADDTDDDSFKIEHVSSIFHEGRPKGKKEITTETLGDLYFTQGQFDRALRIFEKLAEKYPSNDLTKKIQATRARLGVDRESMVRNRRIQVLRSVLKTLQKERKG